MYNIIWFYAQFTWAYMKQKIGLKTTDFENFLIRIGLM